jgi:hypothetical protein
LVSVSVGSGSGSGDSVVSVGSAAGFFVRGVDVGLRDLLGLTEGLSPPAARLSVGELGVSPALLDRA